MTSKSILNKRNEGGTDQPNIANGREGQANSTIGHLTWAYSLTKIKINKLNQKKSHEYSTTKHIKANKEIAKFAGC